MTYDQSQVAFVDIETTGLDPEHHLIWEIAVIVDGVEHVWQQQLPHFHAWTFETYPCMTKWVSENTGIRDRYDHETAVPASDSIDRFRQLVSGRHLVGACPWFDSERLHRVQLAESELLRDLAWHYHLIDVENMAVGYLRARARVRGWLYIPPELDDVPANQTVDTRSIMANLRDVDAVRPPASRTDPPAWETLPWKSTDLSLALGVDPADFQPKHSALADARWAKAMYEAMMGGPA